MLKRFYLWLPLIAWVSLVQADDQALKSKFEAMVPGMTIDSITPLEGTSFYEVVIGGEVVYFSKDAQYVFQGDVIALESRQNITQNKRVALKKKILSSLNEEQMIVFEPEKTEHTLTVFTDIDCGYCRKLHQQMAEYNDLGIRIRYMAFPRSGVGAESESYKKAVNVWCSDDKHKAMTDSKAGIKVASKSCDNPVKHDYETGVRLGVTGTPALFLDSGELLPGYVPPQRLKQLLDERSGQS